MGTFVSGKTALPAARTNGPGYGPATATDEVDADYLNYTPNAADDLRTHVDGWVNPASTAYGAKFDGQTNDAAALALAVADAVAKGRGIIIPARMYLSSGTINITCPIWFVGPGSFDLNTGTAVTISSHFTAATPHQLFYMNGGTLTFGGTLDAVYVQWFGAKGDNSANDGPAVRSAIAAVAAMAVANRPRILVPPGTYKITGSLAITAANVRLVGAGRGQTILKHIPSTTPEDFIVTGTSDFSVTPAYLANIELGGMTIISASTSTRHLLVANGPDRSYFHDLLVDGGGVITGDCIHVDFSINTVFFRCNAQSAWTGAGVGFPSSGNDSTTTTFYDGYYTLCLDGFRAGSTSGITFVHSIFESNIRYGACLGENGESNSSVTFSGKCHFENNRQGTIKAGGNSSGFSQIDSYGTYFGNIDNIPTLPATYYAFDLGYAVMRSFGCYTTGLPAGIATRFMFRVNRGASAGVNPTTMVLLNSALNVDSGTGSVSVQNDGTASPFVFPERGVVNSVTASGTTFTPTPNTSQEFLYTFTGDATINTPGAIANFPPYSRMRIYAIQDGTGGRSSTWNATYDVGTLIGGAANSIEVIDLESDGVKWRRVNSDLAHVAQTFYGNKTFRQLVIVSGATPYTASDYDGGYPGNITINPGGGVNPRVIFFSANNENLAWVVDSTNGMRLVKDFTNSGGGTGLGNWDRNSRLVAYGFAQHEHLYASSATPAFDPVDGSQMRMILTANVTGWTLAAGLAGQRCTLMLQQDSGGSKTLAGTPANVRLAGGALTLSTGANKVDSLTFEYNSTLAAWVEVARSLNA